MSMLCYNNVLKSEATQYKMFSKFPLCEVCGENEANSFSLISIETEPYDGNWNFVCDCTQVVEDYDIPINQFFSDPTTTVKWMTHMHKKRWMNWSDFMDMIERFRYTIDS